MTESEIINWLEHQGINRIETQSAYIFEVGFRGEYANGTPEILLHENELESQSKLGKIVGVIYHQKNKVMRVMVRHMDAMQLREYLLFVFRQNPQLASCFLYFSIFVTIVRYLPSLPR